MKTTAVILFMHIFACWGNASPSGLYSLDTFDVGLIDTSLWTTSSPYSAGNSGVYVNVNSFSGGGITSTKALFVNSGGDTGQPGGLIISAAAPKPDAGQTVVLTADRAIYVGGEGHAWGFMVPGGDGRYLGAMNNSDTDYILMKEFGYVVGSNTYYGLKVVMRKNGGAVFYSNEIYAIPFNAWYWQKTQIVWSPNRVAVVQGTTTVFDTYVNGGSSSIPSVPMNVYIAGGHAYNKLGFESMKLEVVGKPSVGDINRDGIVDLRDFTVFAGHWVESAD